MATANSIDEIQYDGSSTKSNLPRFDDELPVTKNKNESLVLGKVLIINIEKGIIKHLYALSM